MPEQNGKTNSGVQEKRKPYTKPEIIHEQELETRAGSPIPGVVDPLDLSGK